MDRPVIHIREATPGDAHEITRVHEEAWRFTYQGIIPHLHLEQMIARRGPSWWRRGMRRADSGLLLLTFDGTPQGYASYGNARRPHAANAGEIYELYLTPAFVGIGLGKRLFVAARERLAQRGRPNLIVWALADNELACAFYARQGGEHVGTAPETFGDVTLMRVAYLWPHKASRRTAKG